MNRRRVKVSPIRSKHISKNSDRLALLFMAPSLVGVMMFAGIPFLEICRRSFMDARGVASFVIIWRLLFDKNGLINAMLTTITNVVSIHYDGTDWMRTHYAFWILCLCYLWRQIGFYTVLWIAGIRKWSQTAIALVACLSSISYCFIAHTKSMFLEYLIIAGISIYSIYKCEYLSFHMKEHICILGLLTMGEYVTRSNDEEMKAFYQEAIYPLADKEIRMNDCFVALEKIRNDQVKAFLFYKLSYGINSDIDMKLLISTENTQVNIPTDWEFVEMLVRILGIWLDNAMEECAAIKEEERSPQCLIKIKQNEQIKQLQIQEKIVFLSTSDTKILQYVQSNPEPFLCFLDLDLSCSIRLKNSIKEILNKANSK